MMDPETCPCPGWARIVCWLDDHLGATYQRRAWLYRWHMRFVRARFEEAFASGEPVGPPVVFLPGSTYTLSGAQTWTSGTTSTFTGPTP